MRALLLTTQLGGRGGVQYAGRLLHRTLADGLGHDTEVTTVSLLDTAADLEQARVCGPAYAGRGSRYATAVQAVRQWRGQPWDVVLLGHVNLAALALLAPRRSPPPALAMVYSVETWQALPRLRRWGLQRCNRIVYISEHARALSHRANPWLAALPNDVCHLGLLPEEPTAAVPCPVAGPFALVVGRMASVERYKGHEELIRLWPRVQRQRPGMPLVVIGEGDDRPRLEALTRDVGADVRFLGAVEDTTRDACLRACRCFCLPARGEGFGLVYLEAMRVGKPVLAGSTDAGCEVVLDGVTGRTVDATVADELLQGVLDVSGDRAEALGRAGRERFENQFRYDRFLERFRAQMDRARNGTNGAPS